MSYQVIYNPYTGQTQSIDMSEPDAHQQLVSYYQKGWGAATALQAQQVQTVPAPPPAYTPPASSAPPSASVPPAYTPPPYAWTPPDISKLKTGLKEGTVTVSKVSSATSTPPAPTKTATQPAGTTSPLAPFTSNGSIDLVAVAASKNTAAMNEAYHLYGDKMSTAIQAAKEPATAEQYMEMGPGAKKNLRIVTPVSLDKWNAALARDDIDYLLKHYPETKSVSASVYAKLGPGVKEKGGVTYKLKWYEHLTSVKEEKGEQVTAKSFALQVGDSTVLFMHTARNWNDMANWERGVYLFADIVFAATYALALKPIAQGIKLRLSPGSQLTKVPKPSANVNVKLMSPTKQAKAEYNALENMAKEAGAARKDLKLKLQAVDQAETAGVIPKNMALPSNKVQRALMDNLESASNSSMKADLNFGEAFTGAKTLNSKQLAQLEKSSGVKGLSDAVKDIHKTEKQLMVAWKELKSIKTPKGVGYKVEGTTWTLESDIWAKGYIERIRNINKLHSQLEKSYQQYYNVIRPPHVYGYKTVAPRGIGSWIRRGWGKLKGVDIYMEVSNEKQVMEQLYELKKLARRGTLPANEQQALDDEIATIERWVKEWKSYRGDDIDEFFRGLSKPKVKTPGPEPEVQPMDAQLRMKLREVVEKEKGTPEERFWERPSSVATKEKTKAEQDLERLWEVKKKVATKTATDEEKLGVPRVEDKPKFGMTPKKKTKVTEPSIPPEVRGRRTFAAIAREYGEQPLEDAIGIPLDGLSTRVQIKTAIQINQEFEKALAGGTSTAVNALIKTYTRTGNMNKAQNDAMNALDNYLKTEVQPKTQLEPKVKVAVNIAVKNAVEDFIKTPYKVPPPKIRLMPGDDDEIHIEEVEGIPSNPGIVSYNMGIVEVGIHPPYRPGTEDITFVRLKKTQTGTGSEQQTLRVRKGKAPKKVVLRHGRKRTTISNGRRLENSMLGARGPGLLTASGRIIRQRRGSLLK